MQDRIARTVLAAVAFLASAGILLIALTVILEGWPAFPALFGTAWSPQDGLFGAWELLVGSLLVTAGALLLAVPLSVGVALFLAEVPLTRPAALLRALLQGMAAVPSVVFGFLGLTVVAPLIRSWFGGLGLSLLAGTVVLALMIAPTIAAVAEDALRAVNPALREGAYALGATMGQVVWRLLLPAARRGLVAAVVLGLGRALGETMAVLMVLGNVTGIPTSPLGSARTLTSNIALEMAYSSGAHRQALFATGALLLLLVLLVNQAARWVARGGGAR